MKRRVHRAPHIASRVIKIDELFMPPLLAPYIGHPPTDGRVPSNQRPRLLKTAESDNGPKIVDNQLETLLIGNAHSFSPGKLGRFCPCFLKAKHRDDFFSRLKRRFVLKLT